jgi:hypothetical protein
VWSRSIPLLLYKFACILIHHHFRTPHHARHRARRQRFDSSTAATADDTVPESRAQAKETTEGGAVRVVLQGSRRCIRYLHYGSNITDPSFEFCRILREDSYLAKAAREARHRQSPFPRRSDQTGHSQCPKSKVYEMTDYEYANLLRIATANDETCSYTTKSVETTQARLCMLVWTQTSRLDRLRATRLLALGSDLHKSISTSLQNSPHETHLSRTTVVLGLGRTVLARALAIARTSSIGFGLAP